MRISVGLNSVPGCRWLAQITNVWLPGAQGDLMQLSIVWKLSLISKKLNLSSNLDIFSWMTSIIHVSLGSVCLSCQTDTSELQITEVMIRVRQEIIILITWFLLLGEAPSGDFALEVIEHSNCVPHHCTAKRLQAWCDVTVHTPRWRICQCQ